MLAVLHNLIQIDQSLLERLAFALIGNHVGLAAHGEEPGRPARGLVDGAGRIVDMGVWLVDVSTLVAVELCVVSVGDSNGRIGVRIPMIFSLRAVGVPWMTSKHLGVPGVGLEPEHGHLLGVEFCLGGIGGEPHGDGMAGVRIGNSRWYVR